MNVFGVSLFLLVAASAAAAEMSYEQAKVRADKDEESLSAAQSGELVASQGRVAGPAFAGCPPSGAKTDGDPFTVVMELGADGSVVQTWLTGSSRIATCFNKAMSKSKLFVPPRAPFYTSFEMTWTH